MIISILRTGAGWSEWSRHHGVRWGKWKSRIEPCKHDSICSWMTLKGRRTYTVRTLLATVWRHVAAHHVADHFCKATSIMVAISEGLETALQFVSIFGSRHCRAQHICRAAHPKHIPWALFFYGEVYWICNQHFTMNKNVRAIAGIGTFTTLIWRYKCSIHCCPLAKCGMFVDFVAISHQSTAAFCCVALSAYHVHLYSIGQTLWYRPPLVITIDPAKLVAVDSTNFKVHQPSCFNYRIYGTSTFTFCIHIGCTVSVIGSFTCGSLADTWRFSSKDSVLMHCQAWGELVVKGDSWCTYNHPKVCQQLHCYVH